MATPITALSAVVLAGGRARRMGGVNKALQRVADGYLFEHAVRNLAAVSDDIVISGNRDRETFEQQGFTVVDDGEFADHGPLAGILAALKWCRRDYLAIAACDQLPLPAVVYQTLCAEAPGTPGVYAKSVDTEIPTCAVISCTLSEALQATLRAGNLRLTRFMREYCRPVEFADIDFHNINTSAALGRIQ